MMASMAQNSARPSCPSGLGGRDRPIQSRMVRGVEIADPTSSALGSIALRRLGGVARMASISAFHLSSHTGCR